VTAETSTVDPPEPPRRISGPPIDEATHAASRRLADQLRRIIGRLAVVRPPAEELERAADVASGFADSLDALPERRRSWETSEAGLLPRDFVDFSPLSGRRNPIAPPISMRVAEGADSHRIEGRVTFGAAYEGPPGHVHGGFVAAMFDELLGFAQLAPGFTAYLHVDYRKPTPLHRELSLEGYVDRTEGRKRWVRGECRLDGVLLSEAEGLFIGPRSDADYLSRLGIEPGAS
jgi:acyl-coenzyme A thioesterase PaaI-like protein